jgi:hypothetical protein
VSRAYGLLLLPSRAKMFVSEKKWLDGPEREIERKRIMLDHKKIYIYGFDLFMILILRF